MLKTNPDPSSERPFATCRQDTKLVGVYCSFDEVANHPEYLDALQEKVGANVIIATHGVHFPPEILELAPFTPAQSQWVGLGYAEDDSMIHRCAEILHARGMDLWLYGSSHVDQGKDDRYAPVDFDGQFLRHLPILKYSLEGSQAAALCFQKAEIIQWQERAYSWACQNYDIDALYCSHHRYNLPFHYGRLLGCACGDCQQAAQRLGYDFERMRRAVLQLRESLSGLKKDQVEHIARVGLTLTDFLHLQADGHEAISWLKFRAHNVTDSLGRINKAIKAATGDRVHYIVDTVGASLSYFVGHDYSTFVGQASDALYCMAWVEDQSICFAAAWAQALVDGVDGLDESTALRAVYALIGWDDIDLPRERIRDLHIPPTRAEHDISRFYRGFSDYLPGFMRHEYRRAALVRNPAYPSYQTVFPHYWGREIAESMMDEIMELGHDGYIFEASAQPFVNKP